MLLNNDQIAKLALEGMIDPFNPRNLNPFGYDATLSNKFRFLKGGLVEFHEGSGPYPRAFGTASPKVIDPMDVDPRDWEEIEVDKIVVPPGGFVLGTTVERFAIPNDIEGECIGRSSYSRVGIVPHVTPLEAGWCGYITMEIANNSLYPTLVYAFEGIVQIFFHKGDMPSISYATKHKNQYQDQSGVTLTRGL